MSTPDAGDTPSPAVPEARSVRVRPAIFGILIVAIFLGTIGSAMATGDWHTTGRTADGVGGGGGRAAPQGQSVSEIKGWMAIGDVATAFDVPLEEILAAFDLPADTPATTPLKDLESDRFSVPALRSWLQSRK